MSTLRTFLQISGGWPPAHPNHAITYYTCGPQELAQTISRLWALQQRGTFAANMQEVDSLSRFADPLHRMNMYAEPVVHAPLRKPVVYFRPSGSDRRRSDEPRSSRHSSGTEGSGPARMQGSLALLKQRMRRQKSHPTVVRPSGPDSAERARHSAHPCPDRQRHSHFSNAGKRILSDHGHGSFPTAAAEDTPPQRRQQSAYDADRYRDDHDHSRRRADMSTRQQRHSKQSTHIQDGVQHREPPAPAQPSRRHTGRSKPGLQTRAPPRQPRVLNQDDPRERENSEQHRHHAPAQPYAKTTRSYAPTPAGAPLDPDALPVGQGQEIDIPPPQPTYPCATCDRTFNERALKAHEKVCKKVFGQARPKFDIAAARGVINEAKKVKKKAPRGRRPARPSAAKGAWRDKSNQLRDVMKAARQTKKLLAQGVDVRDLPPAPVSSAQTDDRVPCPHCGRRFGETQAERHIPKCKDIRAKPTMLVRGGAGAGAGRRPAPVSRAQQPKRAQARGKPRSRR